MVEYTNIQDNSEEIMNCIVNCDTAQEQNLDQKLDLNFDQYLEPDEKNPASAMPNEQEYIDEP